MTETPALANSASMAGDRAVEVDGAAGVAHNERGETEAARVESGVADAIVIGKAGEKDARQLALAQIAGETGRCGAVILKEGRIGIDLRAKAFAQDQLGPRELERGMEIRAAACLAHSAEARAFAHRRRGRSNRKAFCRDATRRRKNDWTDASLESERCAENGARCDG